MAAAMPVSSTESASHQLWVLPIRRSNPNRKTAPRFWVESDCGAGSSLTRRDSAKRTAVTGLHNNHQHGLIDEPAMLLNPFCPLTTAKVLALKATILVLLTLLIKARVQIVAGSALGIALLLVQTLVVLAVSGGLVLAAGGTAIVTSQQRKGVVA